MHLNRWEKLALKLSCIVGCRMRWALAPHHEGHSTRIGEKCMDGVPCVVRCPGHRVHAPLRFDRRTSGAIERVARDRHPRPFAAWSTRRAKGSASIASRPAFAQCRRPSLRRTGLHIDAVRFSLDLPGRCDSLVACAGTRLEARPRGDECFPAALGAPATAALAAGHFATPAHLTRCCVSGACTAR